jgi:hypothetical protein
MRICGPTFSVFLDSPGEGQFVFSKELSELTEETLGLFEVDRKRSGVERHGRPAPKLPETLRPR